VKLNDPTKHPSRGGEKPDGLFVGLHKLFALWLGAERVKRLR